MSELNQLQQQLSSEETELKREIGVFGGVSIIGGIMIGGGIFYLGSYVLIRTGMSLGWALVSWVLGGLVCMLGGLCFAELGAMMPKSGGSTVYLTQAYHPILGFLSGFTSWLIGSPGSISAAALAFVSMFALQGVTGKIVATVVIIVFSAYNCLGVKSGSKLQNVAMIAKLIPIFIILIGCLTMGKQSPDLSLSLTTPAAGPVTVGKILSMVSFATVATLWAYEGWHNLNAVAEEVKNPKRNLPLSIIIAIGGITLLYTLFNFGLYKVLSFAEIQEEIGNANYYLGTVAAKRLFGAAGGILVTVGMAISQLGSLNGEVIAFPRVPYALAKQGHFFKSFGKLNKYAVPQNAIICQTFLSLALVWFRSLDQLTSLVVFSGQVFNVLIVAGVLILRKKMPDMPRPYKVWGGTFTIVLTILVNIVLMVNTALEDPTTAVMGLAVPAVGVVVYYVFGKVNHVE